MPRGSWYKAELDQDFDLAQIIYENEKQLEEAGFLDDLLEDEEEEDEAEDESLTPTSSVGHDEKLELLMKITDWLQTLNSTLVGVNQPKGKRPPRVRPYPRPVSAIQILRRRDEKAAVNEMLSDLGVET